MVAEAKPSEAMHRAQSNRGHPQANLLMTMSKLSILLATSGSPIPTDVQNGVSRISVGLPQGSLVCSAEPSASCSSSAFLVGCCSMKLLLFASWLKRGYWTGGIGQRAANGVASSCCRARGFSGENWPPQRVQTWHRRPYSPRLERAEEPLHQEGAPVSRPLTSKLTWRGQGSRKPLSAACQDPGRRTLGGRPKRLQAAGHEPTRLKRRVPPEAA